MKRLASLLVSAIFIPNLGQAASAAAGASSLAPGTYTAVTESEWNIELKLEGDGQAVYTLSSWEPGKSATATKSSTVKGRWSLKGDMITVSFDGVDSGKSVIYRVTECLSYQLFGLKGCSLGLNPVTNTMTRSYSQPLWSAADLKAPDAG